MIVSTDVSILITDRDKIRLIPYFASLEDNHVSVCHIPYSYKILKAFLENENIICSSIQDYEIVKKSCKHLGIDPFLLNYKLPIKLMISDELLLIDCVGESILLDITTSDKDTMYFVIPGTILDKINHHIGFRLFCHITFIKFGHSTRISYTIKGINGSKNEELTSISKIIFDSYENLKLGKV
jgi:hypothetical protein